MDMNLALNCKYCLVNIICNRILVIWQNPVKCNVYMQATTTLKGKNLNQQQNLRLVYHLISWCYQILQRSPAQ